MLTIRSNNGCTSRKALDTVNEDDALGIRHCRMNELAGRGKVDENIVRERIVDRDFVNNVARSRMVRRNRFEATGNNVRYLPLVQRLGRRRCRQTAENIVSDLGFNMTDRK